jgi:hypothetical protein
MPWGEQASAYSDRCPRYRAPLERSAAPAEVGDLVRGRPCGKRYAGILGVAPRAAGSRPDA